MSSSSNQSWRQRATDDETGKQSGRLQIRAVPYSPPRLSSEEPSSSRPSSFAETPTFRGKLGRSPQEQDETTQDDTPMRPMVSSTSLAPHDPILSEQNSRPFSPTPSPGNSVTSSPTTPTLSGPVSLQRRHKKVIDVHPDKTFSILSQSVSTASRADTSLSDPPSFITPSSSYSHRSSEHFWAEDSPSIALKRERFTPQPIPFSITGTAADVSPSPSSSWNDSALSGLRKISESPPSFPQEEPSASSIDNFHASMFSDNGFTKDQRTAVAGNTTTLTNTLAEKSSFSSSVSCSTASERTNYKVYAPSKTSRTTKDKRPRENIEPLRPISSSSNVEILQHSSSDISLEEPQRAGTSDSEENYVVYGEQSPAPSVIATTALPLRPEYSRDSLVVPPLRPTKYDSVRRSPSAGSAPYRPSETKPRIPSSNDDRETTGDGNESISSEGIYLASATSSERDLSSPAVQHVSPDQSMHGALLTLEDQEIGMAGPAPHSLLSRPVNVRNKKMPEDSLAEISGSKTSMLSWPQAIHRRPVYRTPNVNPSPLIKDQDEDGDGLADLTDSYGLAYRNRLPNALTSYPSDRSLRSTASSRSNSFNYASIPTWARLYYGKDRRTLIIQRSFDSINSQYSEHQWTGTFLSRSSSVEYPAATFRPRQHSDAERPERLLSERQQPMREKQIEEQVPGDDVVVAAGTSLDRTPSIIRVFKKRTSSIWSPHLRRDKRGRSSGFWDPPWQTSPYSENTFNWKDPQVLLFVFGFVFPLAWIIAAFIPLPSTNRPGISIERLESNDGVVSGKDAESALFAASYRRTKWWRRVNRRMAVLGFLVAMAVIVLTVVGVRQQWKKR